jgi:hypothetical protein
MESNSLIECSCQDLGIVIALLLPLDCEGLPYGNIEGYRSDPSVCRDESSSILWLGGFFWGLVAIILGVCAAFFVGTLYWRKKKRQELLKTLEMSSDNISNLLWNPTSLAVLPSVPEDILVQKHSMSAPKSPQPPYLQAIRTRKAMQLQIRQAATNPHFYPEDIASQPRTTDDEQLHLSLSDSDSYSPNDSEGQTSTDFDSEYDSRTNTSHSSSAIEPEFQGDARF